MARHELTIPRRVFVPFLGAGLSYLYLRLHGIDPLARLDGPAAASPPTKNTSVTVFTDATAQVRQTIETAGANALSFEQAQALMGEAVGLYTQAVPGAHSQDQLAPRICLLRRDIETNLDVERINQNRERGTGMNDPIIVQLRQDHPSLAIDSASASRILQDLLEPLRDGWTSREDLISVIPYERNMGTNPFFTPVGQAREAIPFVVSEYTDFSTQYTCTRARPGVSFLSSIFHEALHLDALLNQHPLDTELATAMKRNVPSIGTRQVGSGFVVDVYVGDSLAQRYNMLDEMVTDYLQAVILKRMELPFALKNHEPCPYHYYNFQQALKVAGISDNELIQYYLEGNLLEFLQRIGEPARPRIGAKYQSTLDFAINHFLRWEPTVDNWKSVNYYYFGYPTTSSTLYIPKGSDETIMQNSFVRCH